MITALLNALIVLPPDSNAGSSRVTTLRFDSRQIVSIDDLPRRGDRVIDRAGYAVYPGLVNAHDHLEMNHYPRSKFREMYTNAAQWGAEFLTRLDSEPFRTLRTISLREQCYIGGMKNSQSGVTTVAHHNPLHRPLRDRLLRRADFPVRIIQRYGWAHSFTFERRDLRSTFHQTPPGAPWMMHLAEGTDSAAAEELDRLDQLGLLSDHTLLIHGVGLSASDRQRMITVGAGLVWCPSTNFYLLGQTAQVGELAAAHLLAIGSDSRLTADGDLLDELRAAHATGQLTPPQLFRAVTTDAAKLIGMPRAGSLRPGSLPDFWITLLTPTIALDPYRALIDLRAADIESVWIGGRVQSAAST